MIFQLWKEIVKIKNLEMDVFNNHIIIMELKMLYVVKTNFQFKKSLLFKWNNFNSFNWYFCSSKLFLRFFKNFNSQMKNLKKWSRRGSNPRPSHFFFSISTMHYRLCYGAFHLYCLIVVFIIYFFLLRIFVLRNLWWKKSKWISFHWYLSTEKFK